MKVFYFALVTLMTLNTCEAYDWSKETTNGRFIRAFEGSDVIMPWKYVLANNAATSRRDEVEKILWSFNNKRIALYNENSFQPEAGYSDRLEPMLRVSSEDGSLLLKNVTTKDRGQYSIQISVLTTISRRDFTGLKNSLILDVKARPGAKMNVEPIYKRMDKLEQTASEQQHAQDALKAENQRLQKELTDNKNRMDKTEQTASEQQKAQNSVKAENQRLQKELTDNKNRMDKTEKTVSEQQKAQDALKTENQRLQKELTDNKNRMDKTEQTASEQQKAQDALKAENQRLQKELTDNKNRLDKTEQTASEHQRAQDALKAENQRLQKELKDNEKKLDESNAAFGKKMAAAVRKLDFVAANSRGLNSRIELSQKHIKAFETRVSFEATQKGGGDLELKSGDRIVLSKVWNWYDTSYNASTGYFTAPIDGVYFFSASTGKCPGKDDSRPGIFLMKGEGDTDFAYGKVDDSGINEVFTTAVFRLEKGDKVWVKASEDSCYFHWFTHFNGFLVSP